MAPRIKMPEAQLKMLAERVRDDAATLLQAVLDNGLCVDGIAGQTPISFQDDLGHRYPDH